MIECRIEILFIFLRLVKVGFSDAQKLLLIMGLSHLFRTKFKIVIPYRVRDNKVKLI